MNCYTLRETFAVWDCLSLSFKIELKPLESRVTKCVGSEFSIKMARSKTLNAFLQNLLYQYNISMINKFHQCRLAAMLFLKSLIDVHE